MDERTILEYQQQMNEGAISARELTEAYLARIREVDQGERGTTALVPNAVIEVNPEATALSASATVSLRGSAGRLVPEIAV